jgi:enoyl-CoA hydratase/carnithine racemase
MPEHFTVKQDNACLHITIDRADAGNAITDPMLTTLTDLIVQAGQDSGIHAVVLRGAGGTFCQGRERGPTPGGAARNAHDAHQRIFSKILGVYKAFRECPLPIIAVVEGKALGFGCALVGGADVAIASRDASFALPEMLHGTPPTLAISALAKVAPKTIADLVYSSEEFDAEHALASGLVSHIVACDELDATVARLLDRLNNFDRIDVTTVKRFIASGLSLPADITADLAGFTMATVKSRGQT